MQKIDNNELISSKKPQSKGMHPGPGFRIRRNIDRPAKELIDKFRGFKTPLISDLTNRLFTMDSGLQNLSNNGQILGPACTVNVFPGDNLMVHKALDIAKPGDIIVVDAGAASINAIIGELVCHKAKHRGITAFVIDGLVRDVPGIKEVNYPVFARGVSPIGPSHRGPGEINYPISCGGIVVNPGDIICGDENGVTVVRKEIAEALLAKLIKKEDSLREYVANVEKGIFSNKWVDEILDSAHCEYNDN
jgi:regulator of RNase E activity RraA